MDLPEVRSWKRWVFFFAQLLRTLHDGDGTPLLWEEAEGAVTAQPGEQEAQRHLLHVQRQLKAARRGSRLCPWCPGPGQEALGTNRSTGGSLWAPGALPCSAGDGARAAQSCGLSSSGAPRSPHTRRTALWVSVQQQGRARRTRRALPASAARGL